MQYLESDANTLSLSAAAKRAGVTRQAVWQAVRRLKLRATMRDGRYVIQPGDLLEWRSRRALTAAMRAKVLDRVVRPTTN